MKFIPLLLLLILASCANESRSRDLKNVKPGKLEFFETYSFSEIRPSWQAACKWIHDHDTLALEGKESLQEMNLSALDILVRPNGEYMVGYVYEEDMRKVDALLAIPEVTANFYKDVKFLWSYMAEEEENHRKLYALYAVKVPPGNKAKINGRHIETVETDVSEYNQRPVIKITMNDQGAHDWEVMTRKNIGRAIAISINDHVLSCPIVQNAISGGETEISGNFTEAEAEELAGGINAGRK